MAGRESELLASVAQLTVSNGELQRRITQSDEQCDALKHASAELAETKTSLATVEAKWAELETSTSAKITELGDKLDNSSVEAENASNRARALEKQNATLKKELRTALSSPAAKSSSMGRSQSINSIESIGKDKTTSQVGPIIPDIENLKSPRRVHRHILHGQNGASTSRLTMG